MRHYVNKVFTLWLPLGFFLLFTLAPFYYMLIVSIKDQQLEVNSPSVFPFWPFHPNLDQYIDLFARTQFPRWAMNTTIVAVLSTLVSLTFGTLAGYALARLRFRGPACWGSSRSSPTWCPDATVHPTQHRHHPTAGAAVRVHRGLLDSRRRPAAADAGHSARAARRLGPAGGVVPGILLLGVGVSLGMWGLTAKGAALNEIEFGGATNLSNTLWALILTYPTFLVPFCTWLLTGYFQSIPRELEESALIDGASRMQAMLRIVVPLALPGILSAFIFAFTLSWNEYIYALIFLTSTANRTIPVAWSTS